MHSLCRWDHNFCDLFRESKKPFYREMHHLIVIRLDGWINMHDYVLPIETITYMLFKCS